jgi:transketolase
MASRKKGDLGMTHTQSIDTLTVNTLRTLAIDAVEKAKSGHPGAPMGLAPVAYVNWQRFLRFNPDDPAWPNRDRFVLSAGHASMLLYGLLHLTGVKGKDGKPAVTLDDIKSFRQLDSRTPGHPEYGWTTGVEATTGPEGQGIAMAAGMAIARNYLASYFNRPGFDLFDFDVYSICGDGCLMEGVGAEAASLAGHLRLSNLCVIYDSNRITIEGSTELSFTEDVGARYAAYGWNVVKVKDGNDLNALTGAFEQFKATTQKPTLIIVDTHIGYGSPKKQDSAAAHGEPLGESEVRAAKRNYGWPEERQFYVPDGVCENLNEGFGARGREAGRQWHAGLERYKQAHPKLYEELQCMVAGKLPKGFDADLPTFAADEKGMAGRVASGHALNAIAQRVPWMVGGSADLGPSTKTFLEFEGAGSYQAGTPGGRNLHFGVREHGMAAITNGMALTYLRPYASTFLVFSDYARPSIRLSALMELPTTYIFTHDSIGLGEDGPTHQPIEHLASLRAIPGLLVLRPADANEVVECWRIAMKENHRPSVFVLSRQNLPTCDRSRYAASEGAQRGAYVLADAANGGADLDVILLATGSEVQLCLRAFEELTSQGVQARVVSMPSWEIFEAQPASYRESVLPSAVKARVAVEQASTFGWARYIGTEGAMVGMHTFGKSAPLKEVQQHFGFAPEKIVETAKAQIKLWSGR